MNKGKFTVKVQKSNIILQSIEGGNTQLITSSNRHYLKMRKAGEEKRIVNHTESGRVTTSTSRIRRPKVSVGESD